MYDDGNLVVAVLKIVILGDQLEKYRCLDI